MRYLDPKALRADQALVVCWGLHRTSPRREMGPQCFPLVPGLGTENAFRVPRISKRQKSVSRAKQTLTTSELMESSQRQPPWSSLTPEGGGVSGSVMRQSKAETLKVH